MSYHEAMNALYSLFAQKKISRKEYETRLAVLDAVNETLGVKDE
ncbi:hypothetical protein [Pantoea sp. MBLJ3]|nr:hypothetical protein [Pantoea sp. MBLJ3]